MASAPPMESSGLMPQPPSYEEAMGNPIPHYPPGFLPPPAAFSKPTQAPYPVQTYTPAPSNPLVSVQTVYVQQSVVYNDRPVQVICPVCSQTVVTRLEYNTGTVTWLTCAGLFIFGCVYGCCLIPFCVNDLQDVMHRCPNCNSVLGVHKRL